MFSFGFLTLDIIIIIALVVILFLLSLKFEKRVLSKLIIVFYPTTLLYTNLPYINPTGAYAQIGTYVGIFAAIFFLIRKNATSKRVHSGFRRTTDGLILSIMVVVQWLTLYYLILPLDEAYSFSLPFSYIFTSTIPYGILILIPLIGLFLTNKIDD